MSTELVTRGAIQNKPKLEYVVQNPQQQEPAIKRQKEPARVVKQPLETSPKAAKKLQKPGRKKKGSERQEHPVIINENADSYLPEDTDVDYSWNERNYGIEEGNETGYGKIVVLKSAYENGRVEERSDSRYFRHFFGLPICIILSRSILELRSVTFPFPLNLTIILLSCFG